MAVLFGSAYSLITG